MDHFIMSTIMNTDGRKSKAQRKFLNNQLDQFDIYDLRHTLGLDSADPQHSYQLHKKVMQEHAKMTRKYKHTVPLDMLEHVGAALVTGFGLPATNE